MHTQQQLYDYDYDLLQDKKKGSIVGLVIGSLIGFSFGSILFLLFIQNSISNEIQPYNQLIDSCNAVVIRSGGGSGGGGGAGGFHNQCVIKPVMTTADYKACKDAYFSPPPGDDYYQYH